MISLKFIPPKKSTPQKAKGKTNKKKKVNISKLRLCLIHFALILLVMSGKKAATEEGGELHVLIKEAKNLVAMKSGGISDSFVKGSVII